jgi:hypothetical protein
MNKEKLTVKNKITDPRAKIAAHSDRKNVIKDDGDNELFGIWKTRKDIKNVERYIRAVRRARKS